MAPDNQPVSDKRRRLFKALSAVPVVATLKPGEALARHSSYQCATQDMGDPDRLFYLQDERAGAEMLCNSAVHGCYLYDTRKYRRIANLPGLAAGSGYILVDTTPIPGSSKVTVSPTQTTQYFLVELPATSPVATPVQLDQNGAKGAVTIGGTRYKIQLDADPVTICIAKQNQLECQPGNNGASVDMGAEETGIFLVVGAPDVGADGYAENWVGKGVWPDLPLNSQPGVAPDTDRLAGTCLDSFGVASSDFTLAKG